MNKRVAKLLKNIPIDKNRSRKNSRRSRTWKRTKIKAKACGVVHFYKK